MNARSAPSSTPDAISGPSLGGWGLLLLLAVVAAYANSLRAPFVYDDIPSIPENASIRQLWPPGPMLHPPVAGGITVAGRPVLNVSFALNYAIGGREPWSYHVFNMLLHASSALVLFAVVRRTVPQRSSPRGTAFAIAALWSLHPLLTQAVTYTVQRAESLMGFFLLLTLHAVIRGVESGRRRWFALSVGACALGMATKEVMVTAPLLVLLFDRTFLAGSFGRALRTRPLYYLLLAATWGVAAALLFATGGNRGGTVGLGVDVAWWAYPLTQFEAVVRYVQLAIWPCPLIFEYGTFWATARGALPYAVLLLPALGATVLALWRWPRWGFLGAWFFLLLAPSSLAPGTIQMIVEHRIYLSLAALAAATVIAVRRAVGRNAFVPGALSLIALGGLTADRNHDYRSRLALWSDTVAKRPLNPRARESLAEAHEERGEIDAALAQRAVSVRLKPDDWKYQHNFARALAAAGRLPEAIQHYEISLRLNPNNPAAHHNLGVALVRARRVTEALTHYAAAVTLVPDNAHYHFNYAIALLQDGRSPNAANEFATALRLPIPEGVESFDRVEAEFGLASALAAARRLSEAIPHYESVLRQRPEHADARVKLANALLDAGRIEDAVEHYRRALQRLPDDAEAHHNLGMAFARLERWVEAQRELETALRLKPDYVDAYRHLEQLRSLQKK